MARKIIGTIILLLVIGGVYFFFFRIDKKEKRPIEQIVEDTYQKCNPVDFSKYYNLEILVRERGIVRNAIILSTILYSEDELPKNIAPLSLKCTIFSYGGTLTIEDNEFANEKYKEYMSDDEIKTLVNDFCKLDLDYLKVDYKNNVYLSPRPFSFERNFMLRVSDSLIVSENKQLKTNGELSLIHI